jgi:hypothetical protein
MRKDLVNFLKAISIFSLITGTLIYAASISVAAGRINHITWFIFLYFILITVIFHYGLLRSSQGNPQAFVRYYMGATTLKLFIHVIVILMYSLFHKEQAVHFIVTFLVIYILYTAFEAVLAVKKFRK